MREKTMNMTTGSIRKILLSFSLPMLFGNLFSQFYSMVDSIVVGRFVGAEALAAVGATTPIILIMIAVLIGLNVGFTVVFSQFYGAKDFVMLRNAYANSLLISGIAALIFSVVGVLIARPVLILMNTPKELLNGACTYLYISFLMCIAQMLYFLFGSAFRALGDSKTPLYCLIISSVLNIVLDLLFVIVFHWGIAGVAWATAISQSVSAIVEFYYLHRHFEILHLKRENFKLQRKVVTKILKLAVPMAFQNSFNGIGSVLIQSAVNGFGTTVIAAYAAATRIGEFAMQPMNTIGNAISVFVAQNFGAKDKKRIQDGVKKAIQLAFFISLVVALLLFMFGGMLASLFVEKNAMGYSEIVMHVKQYLYIVSMPCFLAGFAFVFEYSLRGLGDGAAPMIAGIVELIIKVGVAMFAAHTLHSILGLWIAWPVAYAISGFVAMLRYLYYIRKIKFNEKEIDMSIVSDEVTKMFVAVDTERDIGLMASDDIERFD